MSWLQWKPKKNIQTLDKFRVERTMEKLQDGGRDWEGGKQRRGWLKERRMMERRWMSKSLLKETVACEAKRLKERCVRSGAERHDDWVGLVDSTLSVQPSYPTQNFIFSFFLTQLNPYILGWIRQVGRVIGFF